MSCYGLLLLFVFRIFDFLLNILQNVNCSRFSQNGFFISSIFIPYSFFLQIMYILHSAHLIIIIQYSSVVIFQPSSIFSIFYMNAFYRQLKYQRKRIENPEKICEKWTKVAKSVQRKSKILWPRVSRKLLVEAKGEMCPYL